MTARPTITVDPCLNFGAPSIRGVSTDAIGSMVAAGEPVDRVADEYSLTAHEVLLACWWEGLHYRPGWRRWADDIGPRLGSAGFDPGSENAPPSI